MKIIFALVFSLLFIILSGAHKNDSIKNETIDSVYIGHFLEANPQYADFKEKIFVFYARRNFELGWFENGSPLPHVSLLINIIDNLDEYGILVNTTIGYNLGDTLSHLELSNRKSSEYDIALRKSFDVTLTALFFRYFPEFWSGIIDPHAEEEIEWHLTKNQFSYDHMLDSMLNDQANKNPFIDYRKFHSGYFSLKEELRHYSEIERNGGWQVIESVKLSKGDTGQVVVDLAKRLNSTGDLKDIPAKPVFDNKIKNAVKQFQGRHGLMVDGIVGPNTIPALNTPVHQRIKQILVNLERWRWIPPVTEDKYIYVNIPQFQLYLFNSEKIDLSMPVIVGKNASHTVIFNDEIKYVVVNPYWNIPRSIAVEEMLPGRKKDSTYFKTRDIEVGINGNYGSVDEDSINWNEVTPDNFNFTLRQKPVPINQLGTIKFIFPNQFAIYLHDTPSRQLFNARNRDFSHGCIRVSKPYVLADYLLKNNDNYSGRKIKKMVSSGEENNVWITLRDPLPVYILYFTVWVVAEGTIQFRNDIYGHDKKLIERLFSD